MSDRGGAVAFLGANDAQLALLIDAVESHAIFLLDADGCVQSWNAGAERIKGYEADEILGRHISVFYSDEERLQGVPERILATAAAEGRVATEGWRLRKDGSRFWGSVSVTSRFDPSGDLVGFVKITRDDSDRIAAEERRMELDRLRQREDIATALHDEVLHRIFESGLLLQSAMSVAHDPVVIERLRESVDRLDETIQAIRKAVIGLSD